MNTRTSRRRPSSTRGSPLAVSTMIKVAASRGRSTLRGLPSRASVIGDSGTWVCAIGSSGGAGRVKIRMRAQPVKPRAGPRAGGGGAGSGDPQGMRRHRPRAPGINRLSPAPIRSLPAHQFLGALLVVAQELAILLTGNKGDFEAQGVGLLAMLFR